MSKTYLPIHSDNPELRFVVEKATMEKPEVKYPQTGNYTYGYYTCQYCGYKSSLTQQALKHNCVFEKYAKHLASLTKYPFPALTKEMPDEMIEGVDFELVKQERNDIGIWYICEEEKFNAWVNILPYRYRIIAVPLSVKAESTPTQSGEKKKKVIKSESMPEFDEAIESMTQEQKDRVDKALGESMEDVLKEFVYKNVEGFGSAVTPEGAMSAMQRWASIQCKERDAKMQSEINRLRVVLRIAIERMDRARDILHKDENSNWGMLNTSDLSKQIYP